MTQAQPHTKRVHPNIGGQHRERVKRLKGRFGNRDNQLDDRELII